MQCKWGFAIQMSQNKIFSCNYAIKMTHLCYQALSDWSYASFCTLTSSILHNFYKILETNSNEMQKYKKSEKLYNVDWSIKSHMQSKWGFAIRMSQHNIFYAKRWLICAARPYLTDHTLHFVHSAHLFSWLLQDLGNWFKSDTEIKEIWKVIQCG